MSVELGKEIHMSVFINNFLTHEGISDPRLQNDLTQDFKVTLLDKNNRNSQSQKCFESPSQSQVI